MVDPPSSLKKVFIATHNGYQVPHNFFHIEHVFITWIAEDIIPDVSRENVVVVIIMLFCLPKGVHQFYLTHPRFAR